MRIGEILEEKIWSHTALTMKERLIVMFKHRGFRMIGGGYFSRVFSNGPNVIKVYRDDPSYDEFLALTKRFPSKHFPKVISEPHEISPGLKMARLERLEEISDENYRLFMDAYGYLIINQEKEEFGNYTSAAIHAIPDQPLPRNSGNDFLRNHPNLRSLLEAIRAVDKTMRANNFVDDIRKQNLLQRQDGTIVIADPFGGSMKSKS